MNRLVIGDLHNPFCYPTYRRFCLDMYEEYECEEVIFIGDIVDNHGISRFVTDPEHPSAGAEYKRTRKMTRLWHDTFPNATVIIGNHDNRPVRKAAEAGVPKSMLRSYNEMWDTPTWRWVDRLLRDGVLYVHGDGMSGPTAALRRAINARRSVVMGHTHSFGGVQYHANDDSMIFGLNVGWGGDQKAIAFEYGKDGVNRGCVGCGLVVSRREAYWLPADLNGRYGRRKRRKR